MSKLLDPIAVTSRTFSRNEVLRAKLKEHFANVRFNDAGATLKGESLVEFLSGSTGAIVALELITDDVLAKLPQLRYIAKYGVGLDNLDHDAVKRRGVKLGWTGGVNARSVSELALSFMLGILRNVFFTSRNLASGEWLNQGGFQLSGKTVGIIGAGYIGKDLSRLLRPFDCRILIHDIIEMRSFCSELGIEQVSRERLLAESDIVSLHIPYEQATHNFIGQGELETMKPSAILINTSRGKIVDEEALLKALQSGKVAAAGMDVFAIEPAVNSPLLKLPNFYGTPHIGGSSAEAILAMGAAAVTNLVHLFSGQNSK